MPSSSAVVLGIHRREYTDRNNQEVVNCFLHYYKPGDYHNSRLEVGFKPLVIDIHPDLGISDFESEFPAQYNFKTCVRRDLRTGQGVPGLMSVEFVDNISIDNPDSFLVLGVKKFDWVVDGERHRGVKLFYLDLNSYLATSDVVGLLPIEQNISGGDLKLFPRLPAYYDLELEETRGRKGSALFRLLGATFKAPWGTNDPDPVITPLVS